MKARFAVPLLLLVALAGAAAPATAQDARRRAERAYQQGNLSYRSSHFREAVASYEQARATGLVAPELEFNLANARLKSGQLGRAIAGYERARRMGLEDPDVLASLRYARSLTRDPRAPEQESRLDRLLGRFLAGLHPRSLFRVGLILLSAAALLAILRRAGGRSFLAGLAAMALVSGLLFQAVALGRQFFLDTHAGAVVLGAEVPVRSGPGIDFPAPFALHEGARVRTRSTAGPWTEIEYSADVTGWLPTASLEPI